MSKIEKAVIKKIEARAKLGESKYNTTIPFLSKIYLITFSKNKLQDKIIIKYICLLFCYLTRFEKSF